MELAWAELVETLCVRYKTTPWDIEAHATTATLRHIRLLADDGKQGLPERPTMDDMLANMSSSIEAPIG